MHLRPALGRLLDPVGRGLAGAGVSADAVTVVGTVGVVGGALGFYPRGSFLVGTLVITAFVFSDVVDGAVARAGGRAGSRWGAFLDSSLDRLGDAAVFGGIVLWYAGRGESLLMTAVTLWVLAGALVTSYVKARAEALGMRCEVGLAERSDRLVAVLAAAGLSGLLDLPVLLVVVLWALAVAVAVTVGQRLVEVRRQAAALDRPPGPPGPAFDTAPGTARL